MRIRDTQALIARCSVDDSRLCMTDSMNGRCSCVTFRTCVKYHSGYLLQKKMNMISMILKNDLLYQSYLSAMCPQNGT